MSDFESWADTAVARLETGTNIQRPSDHQSLFKYVSLSTDASWELLNRTLHGSELVGSSAASLNDPFELSPYLFDDLTPQTVAKVFRYPPLMLRLEGKDHLSIEEKFADLGPYRQRAKDYLRDVAERYKIVAFCARVDSGLLWSHYANSYQGICLHFIAKGFRYRQLNTIGYVSYSKYRPAYPLSLALTLTGQTAHEPLKRAESEKILFFTKADDWAYESEVRIIYGPDAKGHVIFDPNSLVSIIVGPRFSAESRERLRELLKGAPAEHLPIRDARLSTTTFSVEIVG